MKYDVISDPKKFEQLISNSISLPKYVRADSLIKPCTDSYLPELYVVAVSDGNIVGCLKQLCLQNYALNTYERTIMYISVHPDYKGKGIATSLIEIFCNSLKMNGIREKIYLSPFSEEGFKFIRHKLIELFDKYEIKFKDSYCFERL